MPITAKLSKAFYNRIGEQAANELVDWLNQVDATFRADLRNLSDRNFAVFEAKMEQRLSLLATKADLAAIVDKFDFATMAHKSDLAPMAHKSDLATKADKRDLELLATKADVQAVEMRMLRWMFAFWITTAMTVLLK